MATDDSLKKPTIKFNIGEIVKHIYRRFIKATDDSLKKPNSKFNIGEKVYFINENNKPAYFFITEIVYDKHHQEIRYKTNGKGSITESYCFKTVEEALNDSLQYHKEIGKQLEEMQMDIIKLVVKARKERLNK